MNGFAEQRGVENLLHAPEFRQVRSRVCHADFIATGAGRSDRGQRLELSRLAADQQLGQVNVSDIGAPLGLIHVVRCDQQGHTPASQFEQQIPELSARDRIDAGGWLIEEQQFGLVDHRAG